MQNFQVFVPEEKYGHTKRNTQEQVENSGYPSVEWLTKEPVDSIAIHDAMQITKCLCNEVTD